MRQLSTLFLAIASIYTASDALASDFSLPFVNSAGLGVAYADWATAATDASTAYTNPAGLVNLHSQQVVANALGIFGTAKFTGTSISPTFPFPFPTVQSGVAKSKISAFMPSIYYAKPLSDRLTFGFNVTSPFGLGTNYESSIARYASTRSQVVGIDVGPSLGMKLNDFISLGLGVDALRLAFTLDNMYGLPLTMPFGGADIPLENQLSGWGYGWHGGTLVDFTSKTRMGLSYNSRISLTAKGHSTVFLPDGNTIRENNQQTDAALPARAQLSVQHDLNNRWTAMATAFYTHWETFNQIVMQRTETPTGQLTSVTIPFNYHNCFDYSVGASFKATEKLLLRGGVQFMNTPSNNHDRGIADPIGGATILAIGAHFQPSVAVGYDLGIGHSFFKQSSVNFSNPLVSLQGHTNVQTTVVGGQINWSIS